MGGEKATHKDEGFMRLLKNGGLQLPNLKLYFEEVALSWLQEWIKMDNNRLLKLEGHDLKFGWHA